MTTQDRIWNELQQPRREYLDAAKRTSALAAEVPTDIPAPDGSCRMAQASRFQRIAFDKYRELVVKYTKAVAHPHEK